MKKIFLSLLLIALTLNLLSQENLTSLMKERDEYYFQIEGVEDYDVKEIASLVSIDKIFDDKIIAYANGKQYERLVSMGVTPLLLTPPSMLHEYVMYDGKCRDDYNWDQYPTYEAYESMMYEFAEKNPDKCSLIELGVLESGRKILVARINNGVTENKPKFLYLSTIHGDETTGYIMMLRLIDHLLNNVELPEVKKVLDNLDIFICPNANPDGTYYSGNHTVYGSRRYNADGIDMNRNYPDYINGEHPDYNDYAAETEMFMKFADDYQFTMSATYHGGAELINYPWDNNYQRHADDEWWKFVSREYATLAQEIDGNYMTDMNNGITNGADWYVIEGSRQDYMNYYQQCRELTIECSLQKCPPAYELPDFWNYNYNSIFAYMNQCINGIHGRIVDADTRNAIEATITILDHDQEYSVVNSQFPYGDFHRPIKAGVYTMEIKSKGYATVYETVEVADNERVYIEIEMKTDESYNMQDTTIVTKTAYFYDSGGSESNYNDNENYVMTFKPKSKGSVIQIEFIEFSTEENSDIIKVYDGTSVNDELCVAELSGTTLPEIITATNLKGTLTLSFMSDSSTNDKGWKSIIRCVEPVNINELTHDEISIIYPNPTDDIIYIETNNKKINSWIIYDINGLIVMQSDIELNFNKIDVSDLKSGLYLIVVNIDEKQLINKIVIE